MNHMDLISVIVPVYKVEAYLDRCVQSIVDQTYTNLEIILVDDGSPDRCPQMCDEWAKRDNRIRVIHQKNRGSGAARNAALDVARGELIAFVDSDDYVAPNLYEHLYALLTQGAEIAECDYIEVLNDNASFNSEKCKTRIYTVTEALKEHIQDHLFRQLIWNKLYCRKVINQVRFPQDRIIDDEFWTYRVIANANKLIYTSCCMYAYRQQDESIMHQTYSMKRMQAVEAHVERHEFIRENIPALCEQSLVRLWFDCRYHGQMAILTLNDQEQERAFDYLHSVIRRFPLAWQTVLRQKPKEVLWLLIEKLSLRTVCKIRNALHIGF